ncbi:MAG: hypothetical protein ACOCZV_00360 [Nanoarchaeota archaeon]
MTSLSESKTGFQLSINMLVVIIIGVALLGIGFSIFSNAFSKTTDLRDQVGEDTQRQISALLEDGSLVVVPYANKEAKRGDYVDFNIGINNEMGDTRSFKVLVTYSGSTAYTDEDDDPFDPLGDDLFLEGSGSHIDSCGYHMGDNAAQIRNSEELPSECGDNWVLMATDTFTIKNNEHEYVPIRIVIPEKDVKDGQYIFNVDVCENPVDDDEIICTQGNDGGIDNRYGTRHKLYVQID